MWLTSLLVPICSQYPEASPLPGQIWQNDVDNRLRFAMKKALAFGMVKSGDSVVCLQGWKGGIGHTVCSFRSAVLAPSRRLSPVPAFVADSDLFCLSGFYISLRTRFEYSRSLSTSRNSNELLFIRREDPEWSSHEQGRGGAGCL